MRDREVLSAERVAEEQLVAWEYDGGDGDGDGQDGGASLSATFDTGNFRTGLVLVNSIGELAEASDHHPDLELRYATVGVRLTSHDVGGVTGRDIAMARSITEHAAAQRVLPRAAE